MKVRTVPEENKALARRFVAAADRSDFEEATRCLSPEITVHIGGMPGSLDLATFYYILEGEYEFLTDGRTFTAGPGSFVYLPKGQLHMHRNAADTPARALVLLTPTGVEKLIEEACEPATDPTSVPPLPEMPEIQSAVEVAQKYGIEVPPPPEQ